MLNKLLIDKKHIEFNMTDIISNPLGIMKKVETFIDEELLNTITTDLVLNFPSITMKHF
jgi:short-subunit dehydrogenase involved in D-alanine esterification of teichoic acids